MVRTDAKFKAEEEVLCDRIRQLCQEMLCCRDVKEAESLEAELEKVCMQYMELRDKRPVKRLWR